VGAEVQLIKTSVSDSDDRRALNKLQYRPREPDAGETENPPKIRYVTPDPEVNPIHSMLDVNIQFAPFYGKLNFLDAMILYSDLYLTAGLSKLDTDQGEKIGIVLGAGERFYVANRWSIRIDFRDHSFTESRAGAEVRKNALSFDIGVSYFIL
jgi:outer membrane beta-barrel protein